MFLCLFVFLKKTWLKFTNWDWGVTWWQSAFLAFENPWFHSSLPKPRTKQVLVCGDTDCDPSTREAEKGGSGAQGYSQQHA